MDMNVESKYKMETIKLDDNNKTIKTDIAIDTDTISDIDLAQESTYDDKDSMENEQINDNYENGSSSYTIDVDLKDYVESPEIKPDNFIQNTNPVPCSLKWKMVLVRDLVLGFLLIIPFYIMAIFRVIVPMRSRDLTEEVALVTFGGSGLGREIVLGLVKKGVRVAVCDTDILAAQETVRKARAINNFWCTAFAYQLDISSWDSIKEIKDEIARDFETHVTLLVDYRDGVVCKPFLSADVEDYKTVVDYSLLSRIWMIKTFLPDMKAKNHGHIVSVVSSLAGHRGIGNGVAYSATEFAVRGMTEALRDEMATPKTNGIKISLANTYYVSSLKLISGKIQMRLPPMNIQKAGMQVAHGISRGYEVFTAPSYMYYWLVFVASLPRKLAMIYNNISYIELLPEETKEAHSFKRKRTLSLPRVKNKEKAMKKH